MPPKSFNIFDIASAISFRGGRTPLTSNTSRQQPSDSGGNNSGLLSRLEKPRGRSLPKPRWFRPPYGPVPGGRAPPAAQDDLHAVSLAILARHGSGFSGSAFPGSAFQCAESDFLVAYSCKVQSGSLQYWRTYCQSL